MNSASVYWDPESGWDLLRYSTSSYPVEHFAVLPSPALSSSDRFCHIWGGGALIPLHEVGSQRLSFLFAHNTSSNSHNPLAAATLQSSQWLRSLPVMITSLKHETKKQRLPGGGWGGEGSWGGKGGGLHGWGEIKGSQAGRASPRRSCFQSQMNLMTNILKIWVMRGGVEMAGGACEIWTVTPDKKDLQGY